MGWCDLSELLEDLEFELWNLWNGLDHEVDVVESIHGGNWSKESANGIGLLLGDAALSNILSKELVYGSC